MTRDRCYRLGRWDPPGMGNTSLSETEQWACLEERPALCVKIALRSEAEDALSSHPSVEFPLPSASTLENGQRENGET